MLSCQRKGVLSWDSRTMTMSGIVVLWENVKDRWKPSSSFINWMDVVFLKKKIYITWEGFLEDIHHKLRCMREGVKKRFFWECGASYWFAIHYNALQWVGLQLLQLAMGTWYYENSWWICWWLIRKECTEVKSVRQTFIQWNAFVPRLFLVIWPRHCNGWSTTEPAC